MSLSTDSGWGQAVWDRSSFTVYLSLSTDSGCGVSRIGPVIIHCLFVSYTGQWLGGKPYRTGHHSLFICLFQRTVAGGQAVWDRSSFTVYLSLSTDSGWGAGRMGPVIIHCLFVSYTGRWLGVSRIGPVIIHCLFVSYTGQWLGGKPYRTGHHSLFICIFQRAVAGGQAVWDRSSFTVYLSLSTDSGWGVSRIGPVIIHCLFVSYTGRWLGVSRIGPVIIHCLFVSFNGQWLGGRPYRTGHHSLFICLFQRTVAGG